MIINPEPNSRPMDMDGIWGLLSKAEVGRLATVCPDGTPYITPVHFAADEKSIYFHCGYKGKKFENILRSPMVCFEVDEFSGIKAGSDKPCNSTTYYRSVIARGEASIIEDNDKKLHALGMIMDKHLGGGTYKFPVSSLRATCVIEIKLIEISGKKHEK